MIEKIRESLNETDKYLGVKPAIVIYDYLFLKISFLLAAYGTGM